MTLTFKKVVGFTLVELLIVLSITMLATALVGGLTLDSVNKYQTKAEMLELQQIFKKASDMAFVDENHIAITLQNSELILTNADNRRQVFQFEHIKFNNQTVNINVLGVFSTTAVAVVTDSGIKQMTLVGA